VTDITKDLESILNYSSRTSIKWWTNNLVICQEALRTGKLLDGTDMTEKDRAEFEGFAGFIQDNLHMIRSCIDGLEDFGKIACKAIGRWVTGEDKDTVNRDFSAEADELTKKLNMEKREREKWK